MTTARRLVALFAALLSIVTCSLAGAENPWPHRDQLLKIAGESINRVFGNEHEDYTSTVEPTSEQLLAALGGPPDPEIEMDDGHMFYSACRPQSCVEKAAEVVDLPGNRLKGFALQHFHCRDLSKDAKKISIRCDEKPSLVIFLFRYPNDSVDPTAENKVLDRLKSWGLENGIKSSEVVYRDMPDKT
jgi:hypothetical protein